MEDFIVAVDILGKIRLNGTSSSNRGRIEILYNNTWGTICDHNWDMKDAMVVCRQLGFEAAKGALCCANYGEGNGPIWLDYVNCNGNETDLFDCQHSQFGSKNCHHSHDASVICGGNMIDKITR